MAKMKTTKNERAKKPYEMFRELSAAEVRERWPFPRVKRAAKAKGAKR